MKSPALLVLTVLLPVFAYSQDFDKKVFCNDLITIVTVFSQSNDSLKGKFIGENSLGMQQWEPKYSLPGTLEQSYERTFLETAEEHRAIYVMKHNVQQTESEDLYKQIVAAVKRCYGVEYFLSEKKTTEWDNNGQKHEHYAATFTFTGIADKGINMPVMLIRSFAIESGLYSVTVELYTLQ